MTHPDPPPDSGRQARDVSAAGPAVEVAAERLVEGGEALAREASGEIVFVRGGLPGERLAITDPERRRGARRGDVVEVIEASPHRRTPSCPWVASGCGGCDLQHLDPAAQPAVKAEVVRDALRRLGRIADPEVSEGRPLPSRGFRTTVRAAVDPAGRAGFRRFRSHEVVAPGACEVAHPLVEELLVDGRFPGASEVTLRAGAATGERLVVVDGAGDGRNLSESASVPSGVPVVSTHELRSGRRAWFHEQVSGRSFRISAGSFFQTRRDGAEALVEAVRAAAGTALAPGLPWVDAYAGVGLLAGALTLGWPTEALEAVQAVERSRSSVADARHNLGRSGIRVVRSDVARWRPSPAELVVGDPARAGLGRGGVDALTATGASTIVLVSCDAAALGRDAGLLAAAGYRFDGATLVDMFPQTHHVEVVSAFRRS